MKLKELQKTVNVAWSPAQQYPILFAAGTAAQQLDASNTNSVLEIYSTNLLDPSYDLELKACQTSPYRFQKILWSPTGFGATHPVGLIVGGCEGGHLQIYSAAKLLSGSDGLIASRDKHTGPIRGLDFNPFQHNLLASSASESEICIWDLNNTKTPMAPGTKTQPLEDILNIAWNKQVQHILASVFSSRCVIWDLRKNEQIIKLSDSQSRVRWRAIQWHPDIATQLWLASEDDQAPYVQLWDLRYATTPAKTIQIHQRGVLGLTWCPKDSDLMVSCGKDNKIYCWNPNSESSEGEILSEIATTLQWYSDVQWCPRNPALIASSSLDGNVSIYSIFGGSQQQVKTSNKIADSFPGMDQFSQAPVPQPATQVVYADLKKAPKWMKKPVGASFGFGGKLIAFKQKSPGMVTISQVITEPELVRKSNSLEKTLEQGNFIEYCRQKADEMSDQHKRYLWYFLKANFEVDPRAEVLNLLGYNKEDTCNKFQSFVKESNLSSQNDMNQITNQMATLTHGADNNTLFDNIAAGNKMLNEMSEERIIPYKIPIGEGKDGIICEALLSGNIEAAVEICIENGRAAEALIISSVAGKEFLTRIQNRYLKNNGSELSNIISALVNNNWMQVVSECSIDSWKEALVAALTHNGEEATNLCVKLGERLQQEYKDSSLAENSILCYICAGEVEKVVDAWISLRNKANDHTTKLSTNELQELVEIVMILKKSLELRGQDVEPAGKLAEFLSEYGELLAAQGALESALSYLGPSHDPKLIDLRERLYYALGHKQQPSLQRGSLSQQQQIANMFGKQNIVSNRYTQPRTSFSSSIQPSSTGQTFNTNLSNAFPPAPIPTSFAPISQGWTASTQMQPPLSTYNPISQISPPQPIQSKPSPLLQTSEGLSQPPRPSSVGSQGRSTPLTRSKYVLDPSVTSGPNYGQTSNLYNTTQPLNYGSQNVYNQYTPSPLSPPQPPQTYPLTQSNQVPLNTFTNHFKPFTPNPTLNNPVNYLSGISPIETAQQAMPPPPPSHKNPTPPPGWNDPPALKSTRPQFYYREQNQMSAKHSGTKRWEKIINSNIYANQNPQINRKNSSDSSQDSFLFQPKVEPGQVNPIMHPLYGVNQAQGQNGYEDSNAGYATNQFMNQTFQPPTSMQQPQQMPFQNQVVQPQQPGGMQFSNQMNLPNPPMSQMYKLYPELTQRNKIEPPPKEKPPLPEEFIYLQTVLEELKNQCLNVAPDARTKRKFVDVGKRLETLYDALREKKLTQNTLTSLNQIVQYIQIGDYQNALTTHTAIVSGPDFAQTASFMPGIKVLVQSAIELNVLLR